VPHARCQRCGCFREPVRDRGLFDAPLPVPSVKDPWAAFIRDSQRREAEARKRGVTRQIGAERRARRDFTHASLRGAAS
jgi:hypothetical protein